MSRYDGLIIPRSYSEYINKTDAATLSQALQLNNVLAQEVAAGNNKAVTSGAVHQSITSHFKPASIQIPYGNFQGNVYIDNQMLTINGYITFDKNIAAYSDIVLFFENIGSAYGFGIPLYKADATFDIYKIYSGGGFKVFSYASQEIPRGTYSINTSFLLE